MTLLIEIVLIFLVALATGWMIHYGWKIEPFNVETNYYDVLVEDLPEVLEGMVLCQTSDVHLTGWGRNEVAIGAAIKQVKADLFLFTGDMIHRQGGIARFLEWIDQFEGHVYPAIAVLGNAEHKSHVDNRPLLAGLRERSILLLTNEVALVKLGDREIQVVGVDDPHTNHDDFTKAFASADSNRFTLLLCHSPDGVVNLNGHRVDLMLCGHTHGGQIRFPIFGAIAQNTKRLRGLAAGWYSGEKLASRAKCDVGRTQLYVSRGLGM
ncbi:MAG: metallophosphoesterase, partial [Chthonomonadales bacterium]